MVSRLVRKLVALGAAYALALTVLLPFLALATLPAGAGASALTAICRGQQPGQTGDRSSPIGHGPACPCGAVCAMAACADGRAAAPPAEAAVQPARQSEAVQFPAARHQTASLPERRRPQAARAPPA